MFFSQNFHFIVNVRKVGVLLYIALWVTYWVTNWVTKWVTFAHVLRSPFWFIRSTWDIILIRHARELRWGSSPRCLPTAQRKLLLPRSLYIAPFLPQCSSCGCMRYMRFYSRLMKLTLTWHASLRALFHLPTLAVSPSASSVYITSSQHTNAVAGQQYQ